MASRTGPIKEFAVPWLFEDLRRGRKTGTAIFEHEETAKKVYFKDGDILFASSNRVEDRLGEFLLRTGKISKMQFDEASETVIKTGRKLGAVLLEMRAIAPRDLVPQVRSQVKEIILSVFSWRSGRYRFDESPLPEADIIPLQMSTGNLILEAVRYTDWKEISDFPFPLQTIVRPVSDPLLLFQEADLDQDHRLVLSLVNGKRSVEEISRLACMEPSKMFKALYMLLALRIVETGETKDEKDKVLYREPAAEAGEQGEKPAAEMNFARTITKQELLDAGKLLAGQNHYEVLGVVHTATAQEIRKAYLSLAKLYHPDQHFKPDMAGMKEVLENLFHAIHTAYETLSNPVKRGRYDLELRARETERARAEPQDNRKIAALQFEQGVKEFSRGNFWGAEEAFKWSMRLDPDNVEYIFHRALALSRIPRRGRDSIEYYQRAIELAPNKIEYYLEFGRFYERHGQKKMALSVYENALKRTPNSEEVRDAINKARA